jgi:hypothetical protein
MISHKQIEPDDRTFIRPSAAGCYSEVRHTPKDGDASSTSGTRHTEGDSRREVDWNEIHRLAAQIRELLEKIREPPRH